MRWGIKESSEGINNCLGDEGEQIDWNPQGLLFGSESLVEVGDL